MFQPKVIPISIEEGFRDENPCAQMSLSIVQNLHLVGDPSLWIHGSSGIGPLVVKDMPVCDEVINAPFYTTKPVAVPRLWPCENTPSNNERTLKGSIPIWCSGPDWLDPTCTVWR